MVDGNEQRQPDKADADHNEHGQHHPKYHVVIDGVDHPWDRPTITASDIRTLGDLPATEQVMLIDENNTERPLSESEVVELKPGLGFAKKVRFKRGC
jgi:hypothetical protein